MNLQVINRILKKLDFNQDTSSSTLFFTSKHYESNEILFEERLILDTAKKLKATAVYFRRFVDNQSSKPQLFIFDNTSKSFTNEEIAELHRKIWSSGIVPLYYVFDQTNINIYDARKQVKYNEDSKTISIEPFDCLPIIAKSYEQYQKYSAKLFANGTFWEQKEVENNFLSKESSENKLIEGLKRVRTNFINKSGLDSKLAHQLLVLSILVKYLEERKDEHGNHVFPHDYFNKYQEATSFCEVLRAGKVVDLFDDLSSHFNGKVFELSNADKHTLLKSDLSQLARYLDANSDNDQLVIWPLYSFEYLPVELISRIYEEFVDQRKDAVYTPIHLARLMVDECMPIAEPKTDYKIIDVSCGSGVFLVAVFKRLVQWWQKDQFNKTGELQFPKVEDLKAILRNSVHGVDIEEASVRLSIFSLSIALCDMLMPTEIWTNLRFDDLREKNIYHGDFFKYLNETEKGQFDLVIGNPPFEDKKKDFNKLIAQFNIDSEYHIPRNQIAMLFLQQAMKLLKPDGLLSFVMPSGPLLYNNTLDFRREFFSRYKVPQIIDCTNLSAFLFDKANIATSVIFVENKKPSSGYTSHIVIKRTKSVKEKISFEIDTYDIYQIPFDISIGDSFVWKSNLLGGANFLKLIERYSEIKTLGEYLNEKKKFGWHFGEGYKRNSSVKVFTDKNKADYLTNKMMIPTKYFLEEKIKGMELEKSIYFESPRKENYKIFKGPHVLIKNALGKKRVPIHFLDEDMGFMREIIGIHAPLHDREELIKLVETFKEYSSLYRFLLATMSGRAGVDRSIYTIKKEDIMNLPYDFDGISINNSINENIMIDDTINYKLEELNKGEKARINIQEATEPDLKEFGTVLTDNLNSIYQKNSKKFKALTPIKTLSYTCFPFAYGNDDFSPTISSKIKEGDLSELMENQQESVHYRRVLRLYQKDVVFLIKPNTLRYWLKSIALRDASDIINDFINSGY